MNDGKTAAHGPDHALATLGLQLPNVPPAAGNYAGYVLAGKLLIISGQLPRRADGTLITGRLGADLSVEQGQQAAQVSALNILAQAKAATGDLSRIQSTLRLTGFMQATPEFSDHAKVMNGASDLMAQVLGTHGVHSRVAVGAASLPLGAATEIDAIFVLL
jgi:enamine deaminase RidA (YjgF/YER057c/UK114 family)